MNDVVTQMSFQDKLKDLIRDKIGDLLSDDDLKKLINSAAHELFFAPTKIRVISWETKDGPPNIHALVKELLEPKVKEMISEWIQQNPEEIKKILQDTLNQDIGIMIMRSLSQAVSGPLNNAIMNIQSNLQQRGLY